MSRARLNGTTFARSATASNRHNSLSGVCSTVDIRFWSVDLFSCIIICFCIIMARALGLPLDTIAIGVYCTKYQFDLQFLLPRVWLLFSIHGSVPGTFSRLFYASSAHCGLINSIIRGSTSSAERILCV
jgi:hypothetical protein